MERMIVFLLLGRNRQKPGISKEFSAMPGILPEPRNALEQEPGKAFDGMEKSSIRWEEEA